MCSRMTKRLGLFAILAIAIAAALASAGVLEPSAPAPVIQYGEAR